MDVAFEARFERHPGRIALLFFTRTSSGPARRMDGLIAHYARVERERVRVFRVDVDAHPTLALTLEVATIPSLVAVRDRRPLGRIEGRASSADIRRLIDDAVARAA
jgi:thioredoxin-like negative regulator of GroEL